MAVPLLLVSGSSVPHGSHSTDTAAAAEASSASPLRHRPAPAATAALSAAVGGGGGRHGDVVLRLMFDFAGKLDPFSARIQVKKGQAWLSENEARGSFLPYHGPDTAGGCKASR